MCDPVNPSGHMILLCFKNGSLTREFVRDSVADKNWQKFDDLLESTPAGNNGRIGFYFLQPEITPTFNKNGIFRFNEDGSEATQFDAAGEVRAVIEGHFLSMYAHATHAGVQATSLWATGGASTNRRIIQIIANIFGVPVYTHSQHNSACLGSAFRAQHGVECKKQGKFVPFADVVGTNTYSLEAHPQSGVHEVYEKLLPRYKELEARVVAKDTSA